jgi:hypothetical protein
MPHSQAQRVLDVAPAPPTPVIELGGRHRERQIIERLEEGLPAGRAVTGFKAVLAELPRGTVELMVVPDRSTKSAVALNHAEDLAAHARVRIFIIRTEAGWLAEHGEIAALLR